MSGRRDFHQAEDVGPPSAVVAESSDATRPLQQEMRALPDACEKPEGRLAAGQSEEKRRMAEAGYRALLAALPDLVFRISKDGTFLEFVPTKGGPTYVSPETFLGKKITEVFPEQVAKPCLACLEKTFETGEVQSVEYRLFLDGELRDYEARLTACGPNEVIALARDITQRRRAEESLRESESRFESLLSSLNDVVWEADADGSRILFINPAVERIYGRKAAEFYEDPKLWFRVVYAEDQDRVRRASSELFETGRTCLEYRIVRPDGELRWLYDSKSIAYDRDGRPVRMGGIAADITRRKEAEEALRRSEQRNRAMLRTIPDFMFRLRRDGTFLDYHANTPEALAVLPEQFQGRLIHQCMPPEFAASVMEHVETALRRGQLQVIEYQLPPANDPDTRRDYEARVVVSGDDEVTAIVRDVTERREAERALARIRQELEQRVRERTAELTDANRRLEQEIAERKQAERALEQLAHVSRVSAMGEMASAMAHELNQPLGSIASNAQACIRGLRDGQLSPREVMEALEEIAGESLRAGEIIRSLGRFVAKSPARREATDVNELVREVLRLLEPDTRRHGADVSVQLDERVPPIDAVRVQIQQVLVNLVRNALEAVEENDPADRGILVRTVMAGNDVVVSVADAGKGVPDECLEKVFQPYFTTKPDGLGMGLSISRTIVNLHGGRLTAVRNAQRGMTFSFTLSAVPGDDSDGRQTRRFRGR